MCEGVRQKLGHTIVVVFEITEFSFSNGNLYTAYLQL